MKSSSLMLAAVFALVITAAPIASAADVFVVKGEATAANAFATIETHLSEGCAITENIGIQPFDNAFKMLGANSFSQSTSLVVFYYERTGCGLPVYSFNNYDAVEIPDAAFGVDGQLDTARLNATVLVTDNMGNIFPVMISVSWDDQGKVRVQHDAFVSGGDPFSIFHYRQKVQPATATFSISGYGLALTGAAYNANMIQLIDGNKVIFH